MPSGVPQNSFTAGELAPSLFGRVDFELFYKGLRTCRNMIVSKYGGVDNRPGTQFLSYVNDSSYFTRLLPFQYNNEQTYSIELGNYTMRLISNGALVLSGGIPLVVSTPWPSSALDMLKFTQSNDVITVCHPTIATQQIERLSTTSWQVVPFDNVNGPFQDINTNPAITVYASNVSGSGVVITSSEDLFTADMIGLEFFIQQSPDNTTSAWEVAVAKNINDIVIFGDNYYQAISNGTTGTIGPTVTIGSCRDGNVGILWRYLHSGFGIVKITGFTDARHVVCTVVSRLPDSTVTATVSDHITNVVTGDVDTSLPVIVTTQYPHTFATNDNLTLSGIVGATEANGSFTITVVDINNFYLNGLFTSSAYVSGGTATKNTTSVPTYYWALPAWGSSQEYPSTTGYFQARQIFGGTNGQPSNIWFSTTGGFKDFSVGNPVLDSDAITYKLLSNQVNSIKHVMELTYLIIFTTGGVYMVQGGGASGNGVITPSNMTLTFQGSHPSSDVAPLRISSYALYIQEKGSQVRTLGYSFSENAFIGQDVTTMSNHLFQFVTIVDWCYQEIPYSCVWCVMSDGTLLGLTFNPEQQITGWHRHDTRGKVESICCITENNADVVYIIVNRVLNNQSVRCIERMQSRAFYDVRDQYFVDCGLTYDGRATDTYATTFTGLDHLEGETVSILADGMIQPQQIVNNGSITIVEPALVVHVGLPYISDFETLDVAVPRGDLRDKKKAINAVSLIVDRSSGFMVGPDVDNLVEVTQRSTENYGAPTVLFSGILDENIPCGWDKKGRIFVRQSNPLALTILSVIPQVESGGY